MAQNPEQQNDDLRLMRLISQGDIEAIEDCYRKYAPLIRRYIVSRNGHHDPEDLLQEVFTRLCQQRQNYHGTANISTYLIAITNNVLSEAERHRKRCITGESWENLLGQIAGPEDSEMDLHHQDLHQILQDAVAKLSDEQRQAINIFLGEDVADEDSEIAKCSRIAMRKRFYRARSTLKGILNKDLGLERQKFHFSNTLK